jgi:hypothetical protein
MNELILELSKKYFVKHNHSNCISIISYSKEDIKDIEDTYDSLTLRQISTIDTIVYGVFDYE